MNDGERGKHAEQAQAATVEMGQIKTRDRTEPDSRAESRFFNKHLLGATNASRELQVRPASYTKAPDRGKSKTNWRHMHFQLEAWPRRPYRHS